EAVRLLRQASPGNATVLLTTRSEKLAIKVGAVPQSLDRLRGEDGVKMLQSYLPDVDHETLLELTHVLDGHPLAMKLAALRPSLSANKAKALADHLANYRTKRLASEYFNELDLGADREENLTLVLSYSYEELPDADKARFRALGILAHDV